uniref:growth hormone secretagogue receptor type 1-like n=1 Tax=Styela clava TaxID=7725 RepID=UPI001939D5B9|nr:growth hormone secretagogue receptor type 1-like [Styela clava]
MDQHELSTSNTFLSTSDTFTTYATEFYERSFGDGFIIGFGILVFLLMIFGILSNSLVVIVIQRTRELKKSHFMTIICSLCISDLMSAMISPFFWYRRSLGYDIWNLPNFFCELFWAVDIMTSLSTSMHVLSFAILRYIAIQHHSTFVKVSSKIVNIWIACIWLIAFSCGFIPYFIFFEADPGVERKKSEHSWPACTLKLDWLKSYNIYVVVGFTVFFFVPMILIVVMSILIAHAVHVHSVTYVVTNDQSLDRRMKKKKQAVLQLVLIVVLFFTGYIPYVSYETWSRHHRKADAAIDHWFCIAQYLFLRASECLNPVVYCLSSSKMRKHIGVFLQKTCAFSTSNINTSTSTPGSSTSRWGEQKSRTAVFKNKFLPVRDKN